MTLPDMLQRVADVITDRTGMVMSPQVFRPNAGTDHDFMDAEDVSKFCLRFPSSTNTGQYRDRELLRLRHAIGVGFVRRLEMAEQFASMKASAAVEGRIITAMGDQAALSPLRSDYRGSQRIDFPSGEYQLVWLNFDITADFLRLAT